MPDIRYACIGGRPFSEKNPTGLTPAQLLICEKIGGYIAEQGYIVDSGNAPGADQAYGKGVNRVNPALLHLHLGWKGFEERAVRDGNVIHLLEDLDEKTFDFYTETARYYRKNGFAGLRQGGIKLMTRNSSIVMPPPTLEPVTRVIAFPGAKPGGGGTGQGMRIADGKSIPLSDISKMNAAQLEALCNLIAEGK
jgi:hypothetical protein